MIKLSKNNSLKYYEDENYRKTFENKQISLDLSHCKNISNVSMLGLVHALDLNGCYNILDVSNSTIFK